MYSTLNGRFLKILAGFLFLMFYACGSADSDQSSVSKNGLEAFHDERDLAPEEDQSSTYTEDEPVDDLEESIVASPAVVISGAYIFDCEPKIKKSDSFIATCTLSSSSGENYDVGKGKKIKVKTSQKGKDGDNAEVLENTVKLKNKNEFDIEVQNPTSDVIFTVELEDEKDSPISFYDTISKNDYSVVLSSPKSVKNPY